MRIIYLVAFALFITGGNAFSQSKTVDNLSDIPLGSRVKQRIDGVNEISDQTRGGGPIWSDDFSNPSNWVVDHDENDCSLDWEVGVNLGCGGFYPIDTILSTTKSNGYAMIDSDEYGGETGGNEIEDCWLTTADFIDLSNYANVVLEFETWYRRYNYERPYLVISTDGVTWPELDPDTDISQMSNVFDIFPDFPDITSLESNPTKIRINITAAAAGQEQVWVRFHWTGTWGYSWFVDDVSIVEQPANDLVAESAYISHNGTGNEYGRIPHSQQLSDFHIGGEYLNFGFMDQNNVVESFDVWSGGNSVMSSSANLSVAASDSTYTMDEIVSPSEPLAIGLYEGSFHIESDEEQAGSSYYENNTYLRNFMITEDIYSLDGIDVHPAGYENVTSIGTSSFEDAADGLQLLTYYEFSSNVEILGLDILLSESTVPGGAIFCYLHDTSSVFSNDLGNPLQESDVVDITQAEVDAGKVTVMFEEPFETGINAYFASVELFSEDTFHIRVLDDLTVPQPTTSSMIYTPDDQTVYNNGNAAAIRLIVDGSVGVAELDELKGVKVFPNPSTGMLNVNLDYQGDYLIEVFNVLGELLYLDQINSSSVLDLGYLDAGVYTVAVTANDARFSERVVIE